VQCIRAVSDAPRIALNYAVVQLIVWALFVAATLAASLAFADPLPIPNRGGSCPNGYLASGGGRDQAAVGFACDLALRFRR